MNTISPPRLFLTLLRISATTLGGGAVMMGLIRAEMLRREVLSEEQLDDMMTLSLSAPGAVAVSMSWQVGWAIGGPISALSALLGVLLPPVVTFLVLAGWLTQHLGKPTTSAFFIGAGAALVALLGSIVLSIGKKSIKTTVDLALALFLALAMILFDLPPLAALLGGTALSLAVHAGTGRWTA